MQFFQPLESCQCFIRCHLYNGCIQFETHHKNCIEQVSAETSLPKCFCSYREAVERNYIVLVDCELGVLYQTLTYVRTYINHSVGPFNPVQLKASFDNTMVWGESQMERGIDNRDEPCAMPGCSPFPSCCKT